MHVVVTFIFIFFSFAQGWIKAYTMLWAELGMGGAGEGRAWKALTLLFLLFFCTVGEDRLEQAGGGPLSWKGTTKLERDHLLEGGQDLLAGGGPRLAACCLASTVHWREFPYQRVLEIFFSKLMKIQCSLPDRRLAHQGHGLWTWKNCCIGFMVHNLTISVGGLEVALELKNRLCCSTAKEQTMSDVVSNLH